MNNEIFDKVTVIIPTFNRYPYLLRLLNYYKSCNFPFKILILDSSTDLLDQDNFRGLLSNNKICYQKTNVDVAVKIVDGLGSVSTQYGVLCADDMFITPNGIKQSVDFLDNNPDFTVAQGYCIGFWLRSDRRNKRQFFCEPSYWLPSITFPDPRERVVYHFSHYLPTFYGVSRTNFLKLIFKETAKFIDSACFTDSAWLGELLLSMLTLIYGKMQILDVFYAASQALPNSSTVKSKALIDLIKEGTYSERYTKFRECLGKHLSYKTQLDEEGAQKAIDEGMSIYLSGCLRNKEPMANILIRKINVILKNSGFPDWAYKETRSLYRQLFLANQKRMDDFRSFAGTPFSKYYEEIKHMHNHLKNYVI